MDTRKYELLIARLVADRELLQSAFARDAGNACLRRSLDLLAVLIDELTDAMEEAGG